ncbi:MAG: L-threonylcarbamoyladenylate synthase [Patescibacteria group bacterium]
MIVITITTASMERALSLLREGGIVAHATETCYGFACDVSSLGAVANLFALKNRPYSSPVSVLFSSVEQAKEFVEWNDEAEALAKEHLPGPLTLILPLRSDSPLQLFPSPSILLRNNGSTNQPVNQSTPTLGLRISSSPLAQRLVREFGKPVTTTSANLHGLPNPYSAEGIVAQFGRQTIQPDLILDSGTLPQAPPSTVIDLTGGERMRRKGSIG